MNDPIWLAEDGRLLKDLRTAAGHDVHKFSRAASISVAQLRQLEEGGDELFYSQRIKFQMGRRLLLKLGADVVRVANEPTSDTPSLFDFSPSPAPSTGSQETLSAAPNAMSPPPDTTAQAGSRRWVSVLSGVGVLLLAGVLGAQWLGTNHEPKRFVAPPSTPVVPTPVAANNEATRSPTATAVAMPTPEPIAAPTAPAPETAVPGDGDPACQWSNGPGNSFMPRGMDKPSTYVHFVTNVDANICVQDRDQKVTQVNLKAGEKITIRGRAPWRIQTPHWSEVSVYFQGYRMPIPASANLVTLQPRTEPLAEPSAQTN